MTVNTEDTRLVDAGLNNKDTGLRNAGLSTQRRDRDSRTGLDRVLKIEFRSHHQMERWNGSRAGRKLKGCGGIVVMCWLQLYQNLSKWSHDWEVTPHCSNINNQVVEDDCSSNPGKCLGMLYIGIDIHPKPT